MYHSPAAAMEQPQLSRGYTRAGVWLLESDDEVPMPKPHPAVSAVQPFESAPFIPEIGQPDVIWVAARKQVRCTYWHSTKMAWKIKSKHIEFDSDMEEHEMQEVVDREAEAMQEFYEEHHNLLGNMPRHDDSAASAPEELEVTVKRCRR